MIRSFSQVVGKEMIGCGKAFLQAFLTKQNNMLQDTLYWNFQNQFPCKVFSEILVIRSFLQSGRVKEETDFLLRTFSTNYDKMWLPFSKSFCFVLEKKTHIKQFLFGAGGGRGVISWQILATLKTFWGVHFIWKLFEVYILSENFLGCTFLSEN